MTENERAILEAMLGEVKTMARLLAEIRDRLPPPEQVQEFGQDTEGGSAEE